MRVDEVRFQPIRENQLLDAAMRTARSWSLGLPDLRHTVTLDQPHSACQRPQTIEIAGSRF